MNKFLYREFAVASKKNGMIISFPEISIELRLLKKHPATSFKLLNYLHQLHANFPQVRIDSCFILTRMNNRLFVLYLGFRLG